MHWQWVISSPELLIQWGFALFSKGGSIVTYPIAYTSNYSIVTGTTAADNFLKNLNIWTTATPLVNFKGVPISEGVQSIACYCSWLTVGH